MRSVRVTELWRRLPTSLRTWLRRLGPGIGIAVVGLLVGAAIIALALLSTDAPSPAASTPAPAVSASPTPTPTPTPRDERAGRLAVVDPAWVGRTAARAGIPIPAMRAYATAQLGAPKGCRLGWTTLAGIGWVESQQGTIGHRTLGTDGRPSTPIVGPALDGHGDFAAVRATAASTAATGDRVWDHAIGPMQFLTSTWRRWGADGDGDAVADPEDIDDAAATAAAYLCASGYDLTTGSGWARGIWSYNDSATYLDGVYMAAQTYAERTAQTHGRTH